MPTTIDRKEIPAVSYTPIRIADETVLFAITTEGPIYVYPDIVVQATWTEIGLYCIGEQQQGKAKPASRDLKEPTKH